MSSSEEEALGRPVSEEDLEKVIRRATELQLRGHRHGTELTLADVRQIGSELGLDRAHLEQALTEVRALSLVPKRPAENELALWLYGSCFVQVSRVIAGSQEEVGARLEAFLTTQECLRRVRHQPGRSLWEPAEGVGSKLARGMNFAGRAYELARTRSVALTLEAIDEGQVMVTLCASLAHLRTGAATGWGLGMGAAAVALTFVATFGGGLPLLLVAPVAAAAGLGIGTFAAKSTLASRKRRLRLALDGLLDAVEQGEAPVSQGAVFIDKVSRLFDRLR